MIMIMITIIIANIIIMIIIMAAFNEICVNAKKELRSAKKISILIGTRVEKFTFVCK